MDEKEWLSHSKEWRHGFHACQQGEECSGEHSEEYKAGYIYALQHPVGGCYVPMTNR